VKRVSSTLAALLLLACSDDPPRARRPVQYPPARRRRGPCAPRRGRPGPAHGPPLGGEQIAPVINAAYPSFTTCYTHSESYMLGKAGSVTIFFEIARPDTFCPRRIVCRPASRFNPARSQTRS